MLISWDFPGRSDAQESACNAESLGQGDLLEKGIPTPVFLPGEFHGQKSLASYSAQGYKESNMTEHQALSLSWAQIVDFQGYCRTRKRRWGSVRLSTTKLTAFVENHQFFLSIHYSDCCRPLVIFQFWKSWVWWSSPVYLLFLWRRGCSDILNSPLWCYPWL